jgi:hypothetical protein
VQTTISQTPDETSRAERGGVRKGGFVLQWGLHSSPSLHGRSKDGWLLYVQVFSESTERRVFFSYSPPFFVFPSLE